MTYRLRIAGLITGTQNSIGFNIKDLAAVIRQQAHKRPFSKSNHQIRGAPMCRIAGIENLFSLTPSVVSG